MIFSIQRFLEDYFAARGLPDRDQYAVSLANLYDRSRAGASKAAFLKAMRRLRTSFFRDNGQDRAAEEKQLLSALDAKFQKKKPTARLMPHSFKRSQKASRANGRSFEPRDGARSV